MDLKDIHKHLVEELKIPEDMLTVTSRSCTIRTKRYGLTQGTDYYSDVCYITLEHNGGITVDPPKLRTTHYGQLNKSFNNRIGGIWSKAAGISARELHRQQDWEEKVGNLVNKYKDIYSNPNVDIYYGNTDPTFALTWFGQRCEIDPEDESVFLHGINCKVPLTAAFDFLNECEVFKLLQG